MRQSRAAKVRWESKWTSQMKLAWLSVVLLVATAEALAQNPPAKPAAPETRRQRQPVRRIVVSIPDRKLAIIENGRVVREYPVAVGAPVSPSPRGEFKIINRIPHPTYYAPGTSQPVVPPGKDNPLGTRWLGLSLKGYGIHGTNAPRSIGRRASHGCIRMRNRDVEELFELVRAGDAVELHAERNAVVAQVFGLPQAPAAKPAQPGPVPVPFVVASVTGR